MMTLMPTGDNVVIQVEREEEKLVTQSGIIIPKQQNQQHRPDVGVVVAVGSGRVLNDGRVLQSEVAVGNKIIFNKFAGTEIATGGEMYLIIKENDILVIIE